MSDTPPDVPAGWHTDPLGRHELRDWDGSKWTDHVSDAGVTSSDPVTPKKALFSRIESAVTIGDDQNDAAKDKVKRQVDGDGLLGTGVNARTGAGGGALFSDPVLVVNQTTKLVELNNEYSVYDQDANTIATVRQVGQSSIKQAARLVSSFDQFMTHTLEVSDPSGDVLLRLKRPKKIVKSSMIVSDADENEVARITKTFEGIMRTAFTTADNYVVQIHQDIPEPLHSLVVASALTVDTALKQDDRGFN